MSNAGSNAVVKPASSRLSRCMRAPFRVLARARDMYVRGLGACAGRVERGRVIPASAAVPRSGSRGFYQSRSASARSGGDDDANDLVRAALSSAAAGARSEDPRVVPRSQSVAVGVGIGRIDEDRPLDFGDDRVKVGVDAALYPRSRSVAVVEKRRRAVETSILATVESEQDGFAKLREKILQRRMKQIENASEEPERWWPYDSPPILKLGSS